MNIEEAEAAYIKELDARLSSLSYNDLRKEARLYSISGRQTKSAIKEALFTVLVSNWRQQNSAYQTYGNKSEIHPEVESDLTKNERGGAIVENEENFERLFLQTSLN